MRVVVTDLPEVVRDAHGVVLPGVGAFADAVDNLRKRGLFEVVLWELGLCGFGGF